jgi:hypothetical protein
MDLGSQLSKMFGDHKGVEVTAPKNTSGDVQNTDHYRSSTTNSYNKCIRELAGKFPPEIIEQAIKAIDRHDQNNFDESVELGIVNKFNEDTGEQYSAGRHVLRIVGKYEFKWFAHCKVVEMWIELCKSNASRNPPPPYINAPVPLHKAFG